MEIKPGRIWYGMGMLISLVGCAIAVFLLTKGITSLTAEYVQYKVPGEYEINFSKPGEFSIYYEYQSILGDTGQNIPDINCSLKSKITGREIHLSMVTLSSLYKFQDRVGIEVWEFTITEPGQYILSAGYSPNLSSPEIILTVGREYGTAFWEMLVLPLKILAVFECGSILVFLIIFIKRRRFARFMEVKNVNGLNLAFKKAERKTGRKTILGIIFLIGAALALVWIVSSKLSSPPALSMKETQQKKSGVISSEEKVIISEKKMIPGIEKPADVPEKEVMITELEKEAKDYADEIAYLVFESWDAAELKKQLVTESAYLKTELDKTAARLSARLGYLKEYPGSSGSVTVKEGKITAYYQAEAIFEKGSAGMTLSLVKRGEEWRISRASIKNI